MKKILLIITGIIVFISVPVIVFYLGQQQELRKKAAPATTLTMTPDSTSISVGQTVVCKIIINTGENKVASIKASIVFDQTKFEALSITNSTLAPRILSQGTVGAGTATITVGAENTTKPITGQGEIAILRLKAIEGSTAPLGIQFAADTFVAGIGEDSVNVLVGKQPALISVTGGTLAEAVSPTPSPLLTPTGVPLQTPTPTSQLPETLYTQPTSASASALTLSVSTEATRGGIPLIQGTSPSNATITLVIYSTPPQTIVVTANTNGIWETKPTTTLKTGIYTIVATSLDATTGTSNTLSSTFTIGGGIGGAGDLESTGDALPQSGSTQTTLILLVIGSTFLVVGAYSLTKKHI